MLKTAKKGTEKKKKSYVKSVKGELKICFKSKTFMEKSSNLCSIPFIFIKISSEVLDKI